jgi:hypothetical protein
VWPSGVLYNQPLQRTGPALRVLVTGKSVGAGPASEFQSIIHPKRRRMQRVERQARKSEVARTGRIPVGTDVHHHHLRNPNSGYLLRVIRETEAMISSGECHPDWGRKRIEALQKMLEAKKGRFQKKRASK